VELTQSQNPESFLRPYVDALLHSCAGDSPTLPLFELYYREALTARDSCINLPIPPGPGCFLVDECPPEVATLAEVGDVLASRATTLFWEVSTFILGDARACLPEQMWGANDVTNKLN
jgi:hypothetical protein